MKIFKFKKCIATSMMVFLFFNCFVLSVVAVDVSKDVFVIEDKVYSDISQNLSGNGWKWDASKFTLTIDGYNSGPIMFVPFKQSSKTFKIVVKNNNSVCYDKSEQVCPVSETNSSCLYGSLKCIFCQRNQSVGALYIKNCATHISGGGILNATLSGSGGSYSVYSLDRITVENTTINCIGKDIAFYCQNLIVKNSILKIDSPNAYYAPSAVFENSTLTYKNSVSNELRGECVASGGDHTFKNCTVDILVGARPLDNTKISGTYFAGIARYVFDNTTVKVRQGQHNLAENSIVLFSLGFPSIGGNWLTIKNNSRFEFDECLDKVFAAHEINISDSVLTGTCTGTLFAALKLNITNSDVDVLCKKNVQYEQVLFKAHEINIKNSKIKCKTSGNIWEADENYYPSNKKILSLTDTQLDLEGKVDKFGDKWSLTYTTPEKWVVNLDGVQSNMSVNSSKLDLRHEKIVIKVNENYVPPRTSNGKGNTEIGSSSVSDDESNILDTQSTEQTGSNNKDTETTMGNSQQNKATSGHVTKIVLIVVLSVLIVGTIGLAVFLRIKKRATNKHQD